MTIVDIQRAGPPRTGWRWTRPLLIASLALNLAILGALGSAWVHFRRVGPLNPNGPGANLLGYVTTLPAARRDALIAGSGRPQQELRSPRQDMRTARGELDAALAAEPFDRARFIAAQKALFEAEIALRTAAQRIAGRLAEQLTPDELRAYGAWHPPGRGGRRGPGEERDRPAGQR